MLYTSPFELFNIKWDYDWQEANFNLAKKTLLAELDLSETGTILRGGKEYSKNDILIQFDALGKLSTIDFHHLIRQDPALQQFLTQPTQPISPFRHEPRYQETAFIDFISPYFQYAYKTAIQYSLEQRKPEKLADVLKLTPLLLTPYDRNKTWLAIDAYLTDKKNQLDSIADIVYTTEVFDKTEIHPFIDNKLMECLNLLPEQFADFRDNYAISVHDIASWVWNAEAQHLAVSYLANAQTLHVSEYIKQQLNKRQQFFDQHLGLVDDDTPFYQKWRKVILRFLIFIVVISAYKTCVSYQKTTSEQVISVPEPVSVVSAIPMTDATVEKKEEEKPPIKKISTEDLPPAYYKKEIYESELKMLTVLNDHRKAKKISANMNGYERMWAEAFISYLRRVKTAPKSKREITNAEIDSFIVKFEAIKIPQ